MKHELTLTVESAAWDKQHARCSPSCPFLRKDYRCRLFGKLEPWPNIAERTMYRHDNCVIMTGEDQ